MLDPISLFYMQRLQSVRVGFVVLVESFFNI